MLIQKTELGHSFVSVSGGHSQANVYWIICFAHNGCIHGAAIELGQNSWYIPLCLATNSAISWAISHKEKATTIRLLYGSILLRNFWLVSLFKMGKRPLSLHAFCRSLLMRTSTADTRSGQSERYVPPVPIKTRERPSRLSGQTRIIFTQPCVTTQFKRISRNIVQKAVLFLLHFPSH